MATPLPHVYVASPLGFTEAGRIYNRDVLIPALQAAGFTAVDPWDVPGNPVVAAQAIDNPEDRLAALAMANEAIGRRNADLIDRARVVLAVVDGADVDSGTAAEIGYAAARGIPVIGLHTDLRATGDNEAAAINLQVEYFITKTGGTIVRSLEDAVAEVAARVKSGRT